jgi:hypothetical protein
MDRGIDMTDDFKRLETEDRLRPVYSEKWTQVDAARLREILKRDEARGLKNTARRS